MEQTIGRMLYLAHRAVHDELDRRLHEHGASLWNWVLLDEAANADGASQRELAELMRIEPPTLVRHLDKLAEEGLVERRPDPDDRRVLRVVVTDAGHARLTELRKVVHDGRRRAARDPDQARRRGAGSSAAADPRLLRPGRSGAGAVGSSRRALADAESTDEIEEEEEVSSGR